MLLLFLVNMAIATSIKVGGYDYHFVDSLNDRLICKICHLPSINPYLSVCCGHLFCKSCLDKLKHSPTITNACPVCRDEEFVTFPNKAVDREIKCLHVYCTNKVIGCDWQGELSDINNHLGNSNGCQFEEVQYSNECGKMIEQRHLTSHLETECPCRKVSCQYCYNTGEHQFIEGQHKEECPKLPLPCPNKCEVGSVPREDMEKHRKVCQLEIVNCFNNCGEKLKRQGLFNHIWNQCRRRNINCQYCRDTGEHWFIVGQHKKKCSKFPLLCPNKCEVGNVPREDMEAHRKECPLEMIQCEYYSVGCEARMARKDQEKHLKENVERHLMKANLALTNQLANALQRINTLEALLYLTTNKTVTNETSSTAMIESSLGRSAKLAAMVLVSKSDNQMCPVILKMSNYEQLKNSDVTWCSDPFYTDHKGYKMIMEVYPNGFINGKGTHLACFLILTKGPHDDSLLWPLRNAFELKLLNQISDSQHHLATVNYDNSPHNCNGRVTGDNRAKGWGKNMFISNEHLYKITSTCQYLKDGCLFLQITKL